MLIEHSVVAGTAQGLDGLLAQCQGGLGTDKKRLVGGLEHFDFSIYWEESSQLTNIFQRGSNHQPAFHSVP